MDLDIEPGARFALVGTSGSGQSTLLPAPAARRLGTSSTSIALWAVVFGVIGTAVGFVIALLLGLPTGPVLA